MKTLSVTILYLAIVLISTRTEAHCTTDDLDTGTCREQPTLTQLQAYTDNVAAQNGVSIVSRDCDGTTCVVDWQGDDNGYGTFTCYLLLNSMIVDGTIVDYWTISCE